jgi:hypothetical protein
MSAAKDAGVGAPSWFAVAGRAVARDRSLPTPLDDERAISGPIVMVASLFLALLAAALLAGGHNAIDPLLQAATAAREARGVGEIVYTLPDGVFCRHMSFDNTTAEVVDSRVERCRTDIAGDRVRPGRGFAWGARVN